MGERINKLVYFLKVGIWAVDRRDVSAARYIFYGIVKKLLLAVECFTARRMIDTAGYLTYSSLLAIVPIMAVLFAVARGFGYNRYIEAWFRDILSSQPQAADIIVGFVNSYLVHTRSGVFLGIGLVVMLWTVIMLVYNIEQAFNNIWQVKKPRSLFRTITDYMGMFLLAPVIIVISSGLSIFMATVAGETDRIVLLGPAMRLVIAVMPYVFMSAVFVALYIFMPNTKVKFVSALFPGILAGVAMQGLQLFYIHSQIWVSSYNAIYGSFAALPLFMLWVQISWIICLFGAELCYASQNLEDFAFRADTTGISHRYRLMLSALLMSHICRRFEKGEKPYTALELRMLTNIPIRITQDLLYNLTRLNLLSEVTCDEKGEDSVYQPAEDLRRLTVGALIDRMECDGRWTFNLKLDGCDRAVWAEVLKARADYLDRQRQVLLKDL